MIGNECIYPKYEKILISKGIRFEKCISKKSKRLWLKINPFDYDQHFDFFQSIPTYVKLVLDQ
jgi:murein endopeptidase